MKKAKLMCYALALGLSLVFSQNTVSQCSGTSIQLDGINDFLYTPFHDYDFSNFTLEFWFNVPTYNDNVHYISLYKYAYLVVGDWVDTASFTTWAAGLEPYTTGSSLIDTTGIWQHMAFVYDGINQYIYINGSLDQLIPSTGNIYFDADMDSGLVIGARYEKNTQYLEGMIDEVRIWNIPRSQVDIQNSMSSLLAGNEQGLVAYYQFEDGAGSDTVSDITGNGNTLSLVNMDINNDWISDSPVDLIYNFTETVSVCPGASYIFPDGESMDSIIGPVMHVSYLSTVNSCDSIITTTVEVHSIDTSVSVNGITLIANTAGADYQWIDCNEGNSIITGQINQTFTPDASGGYAVIITENSCTDTSGCHSVTVTGLNENKLNSQIIVYPNPAVNTINIEINGEYENLTVELINISNQKIILERLDNKKYLSVDISNLTAGIYFIKLYTERDIIIGKIIKE